MITKTIWQFRVLPPTPSVLWNVRVGWFDPYLWRSEAPLPFLDTKWFTQSRGDTYWVGPNVMGMMVSSILFSVPAELVLVNTKIDVSGTDRWLISKYLLPTLSQCLQFLPQVTFLPNGKRSFAEAKMSLSSSSFLSRGEKPDRKLSSPTSQLLAYNQK